MDCMALFVTRAEVTHWTALGPNRLLQVSLQDPNPIENENENQVTTVTISIGDTGPFTLATLTRGIITTVGLEYNFVGNERVRFEVVDDERAENVVLTGARLGVLGGQRSARMQRALNAIH